MTTTTLGTLVYSFFIDHLAAQKGLRPATIRSYRDTLRLFLMFVAADARPPITQLHCVFRSIVNAQSGSS